MTLQEILKANGVGDDSVAAILAAMKENKIFTAGEENLDTRYQKLRTAHDAQAKQITEATALIEQLKAGTKDNEALQGRIGQYETQVQALAKELEAAKIDAAIKVALAGAKAKDVEYMAFKLREKGDLTLDDHGNIKGIDDMLAGLKTQFPDHFETADTGKNIQVQRLPSGGAGSDGITKEDFAKMGYSARVKLRETNPELYEQFTKQ